MDGFTVLLKLDMIVVDRLFGNEEWSLDAETAMALMRSIEELGLKEKIGEKNLDWRCTPLGKELHLAALGLSTR
jgi:hypothetical protein